MFPREINVKKKLLCPYYKPTKRPQKRVRLYIDDNYSHPNR